MRSFSASQGYCHSEDDILAEIDRDSPTEALMHLGNVKIASVYRHLAGIVSKQETKMSADGPDNSRLARLAGFTHFPVIFGFHGQKIRAAESVVFKSPQRRLIIDVGTANS